MKNIHAFTETGPAFYPGYISVNDENGVISITVRSSGNNNPPGSFIRLNNEQLAALHADIGAYLGKPAGEPEISTDSVDPGVQMAAPIRRRAKTNPAAPLRQK